MNYKTLAALFLTVTSLSVQAEQRWFEVELLLFERNTNIQDITEQLSSDEITVDTSNSINMLKANRASSCIVGEVCLSQPNPTVINNASFDSAGNNFKRLGSSHLQFVAQRERLEKHAGFNPVLHMAWRMPVGNGNRAKPIHIFAGENLASKMPLQQISGVINNEESSQLISEVKPTISVADKWAIDGNFQIYLDHYLFIDSQLIIRKAVTEEIQQPEQLVELIDDLNGVQIAKQSDTNIPTINTASTKRRTVIKEVLFDQNRRLRSGEIHYLDHPLMGIIVQIRKMP